MRPDQLRQSPLPASDTQRKLLQNLNESQVILDRLALSISQSIAFNNKAFEYLVNESKNYRNGALVKAM